MTIQSTDTSALAQKVAERAEVEPKHGKTLQDYIREQIPEVAKGLPPGTLTPDRFVRTIFTEIRRNEGLSNCTVPSFLGAMMQSAQLGLEVGNALGQAYLIPYKDRNRGVTECQFQIGYKGWITIGARSGILIESREVREADEFTFRFGTSPYLDHAWDAKIDRGPIVCFYGTATMPDGRMRFHVMSIPEIDDRKNRSAAVRAGVKTPWDTDYDAMCRKTVIRAMIPQLPMSAELNSALAVDEATVRRTYNGDLQTSFPTAIEATTALQPGDIEVSLPHLSEAKQALQEIIEETEPPAQKMALSDFLVGRYGSIFTMDEETVQDATDIALGWPETKNVGVGPHVEDGAMGGHAAQYIEPPSWDTPEAPTSPQEPPVATDPHPSGERATGVESGLSGGDPTTGLLPGVGISDELAQHTMRSIESWPIDTVNGLLRQWGVQVRANAAEKSRRLALYQVLAPARAAGHRGAVDLF